MLIVRESEKNAVAIAAKLLSQGKIIAFATETVYALACDAKNDLAVKKLYQLKKRNNQKPIAVLVGNIGDIKENFVLDKASEIIAGNFMPGALTLILDKKNNLISKELNNGGKEIGVRIPHHQFCLNLLKEFNGIIAATSANISEETPSIKADEVEKYFANNIDLLVNGGICSQKIASTVAKIKNSKIEILREGLIKKNQLSELLSKHLLTLENSSWE